ncbi:MAG: hypothetical protein IIT37_10800, partial [Bacteroidales bacterium]|nr:hypothetical protein [Bacteroidales bacterium]
ANVLTKLADHNVQEIQYLASLTPEQTKTLGDDYMRSIAIAHEIIRVMRTNKDTENARLYAGKYAAALQTVPLLTNATNIDIESEDFYNLFTRLNDNEKQIVQIYLYMLADDAK